MPSSPLQYFDAICRRIGVGFYFFGIDCFKNPGYTPGLQERLILLSMASSILSILYTIYDYDLLTALKSLSVAGIGFQVNIKYIEEWVICKKLFHITGCRQVSNISLLAPNHQRAICIFEGHGIEIAGSFFTTISNFKQMEQDIRHGCEIYCDCDYAVDLFDSTISRYFVPNYWSCRTDATDYASRNRYAHYEWLYYSKSGAYLYHCLGWFWFRRIGFNIYCNDFICVASVAFVYRPF